MGFNVTNVVGEGTDEELLVLVRSAIARISVYGQYRTTDGRMLNESNLTELKNTVVWLEGRIANATRGGSRQTIARRNRPA